MSEKTRSLQREDALLQRLRRGVAEVRRLTADGEQTNRDQLLALTAELNGILGELVIERDHLGESIDLRRRHSGAAASYRRTFGLVPVRRVVH